MHTLRMLVHEQNISLQTYPQETEENQHQGRRGREGGLSLLPEGLFGLTLVKIFSTHASITFKNIF